MRNFNFLSNLSSPCGTDRTMTLDVTVGSPSGMAAKMEQKGKMSTSCLLLASYLPLTCLQQLRYAAMVLLLITGIGNAWGANQTYTLVSDLSTLTSSDKVLIVSSNGSSNYYALKNNQVTSAANLGETSVTISSNTITADLDADYTWYLEYKDNETIGGSSYRRYYIKSTKGTYYLQNAGDTKSTIKTKSTTDSQNVWVIGYKGSASIKVSGNTSTYYVTGLYNRANSRMLAHASSDWRCYASTSWNNLSNRVVQIYKQGSSCDKAVTLEKAATSNGSFL